MSSKKADVVIEAVRYSPEGKISTVRAYLRRAAVFSDRALLDRSRLLEKLEAGQHVMTGQRIASLGANFTLGQTVYLSHAQSGATVIATRRDASGDELEGTPLF